MGEFAGNANAYLPFNAIVFNTNLQLYQDRNAATNFIPGQVFDALVTFPKASIPKSLSLVAQ